jgi:hypothetical protein
MLLFAIRGEFEEADSDDVQRSSVKFGVKRLSEAVHFLTLRPPSRVRTRPSGVLHPAPRAMARGASAQAVRRAVLAMLVSLLVAPGGDAYTQGETKLGCPCKGSCERTVDSPFQPWCYTSDRPAPAPTVPVAGPGGVVPSSEPHPCGKYSVTREAYWAPCTTVVQAETGPVSLQLTTFTSMWTYMKISTVAATTAAHFVLGCAAAAVTGKSLLWLPSFTAFLGFCHAFFVGSVFSAAIAFLYLSVPYAVDVRVAVAMGCGLAVLLTYSALGRHHKGAPPPHASELGDF